MTPISESDLRRITSRDSLVAFLRDRLNWPAPPDLPADDMFYDYSADELRLDQCTAERVLGEATLREVRLKAEKHITNAYLKPAQAPVGAKPALTAWMELN